MMRVMRALIADAPRLLASAARAALAAMIFAFSPLVVAHEMTMAEMELRETSPGEFLYVWSASNVKRPSTDDLVPRWPEGCTSEANSVHCGAQGLRAPSRLTA